MSVADFFAKTMNVLRELAIEASISATREVVEAIRFEQDRRHESYDLGRAALLQAWCTSRRANRVSKPLCRQVEPVHSSRGLRHGGDTVPGRKPPSIVVAFRTALMGHAGGLSHEVSSAGFGQAVVLAPRRAAFYAYAYPEPAGFSDFRCCRQRRIFIRSGEFVIRTKP